MRWRSAFLFTYFEHRSDVSTSVIFHSCASSVISSSTVTSILFTLPLNSAPALKRLTSFFLTFKIKSELVQSPSFRFSITYYFCLGLIAQGRLNFYFLYALLRAHHNTNSHCFMCVSDIFHQIHIHSIHARTQLRTCLKTNGILFYIQHKIRMGTSFVNYFFHDFLFLPWAHRPGLIKLPLSSSISLISSQ